MRDELGCMAFGSSSETITKKARKARRSLFVKRQDFPETFLVRRIANALQAKGCKISQNSSWDLRNGWDANNGDHRRTLWDTISQCKPWFIWLKVLPARPSQLFFNRLEVGWTLRNVNSSVSKAENIYDYQLESCNIKWIMIVNSFSNILCLHQFGKNPAC